MSDLYERLRAAQQRQREAEEAIKEKTEEEQVKEAEQKAEDAEAVADLRQQGKRLNVDFAAVETPSGCVIVGRPNAVVYRAFQDAGKFDSEAQERLVWPCVLYPEKAQVGAIFDEFPATVTRCAAAVTYLAGMRNDELQGKLTSS